MATVVGNGSRGRRALLALLAGLVTLGAIELGARGLEWVQHRIWPPDPGETAFAVLVNPAPAFRREGAGERARYVRTKSHWLPPRQEFAATKPANGLRVFSLGGSAALGWPHGDAGSYARLLSLKLERLYPGRPIEVINAAGNTYASYRVKVVFDEIVAYDPDIVLIWSGNNELLEDVVYGMVQPPWPWNHSAIARILHVASGRARGAKPVVDVGDYEEADNVSSRVAFAFGRVSHLREDPVQMGRVADHYRYNLEGMLRSAREHGIHALLVDVPVNLADWWPNVSRHRDDLSREQLARFRERYGAGARALEAGRPAEALAPFDAALEIDPDWARLHFVRGRALRALGRGDEAAAAFRRALEEDAHPFRDLPRFAEIRRELADAWNVPLVDAPGVLARMTPDGIPGLDVFVDYVHPTVAANEAIAHATLRTLAEAGWLPPERHLPLDLVRLRVPPDAEDALPVLLKLYPQFLIMRQYEQLGKLAARIERAARPRPSDDDALRRRKQSVVALVRETQRVIEPYRALLEAERRGTLERDFTPAQARSIHAAYVELIRQVEARELAPEAFAALVPELEYGHGDAPEAAPAAAGPGTTVPTAGSEGLAGTRRP